MSSTPLGLFLKHCIPLLGGAAFLSLALWVGLVFSVSWLSGRARWMADSAEIGSLATALDRRWAIPSIALAVGSASLWLWVAPGGPPAGASLVALACAMMVLAAVHSSVSRRARQVSRGSLGAARGEGVRRLFLVLSLATIVVVMTFRIASP
jgi:hypothetical protein